MNETRAKAQQSREYIDRLKRSRIYRDYEEAFRATTGLPLNLRALDAFDLPHHNKPNENPFCALMANTNQSCAACLQHQRRVEEAAQLEVKTLKCFAGLCESTVPVRVGDNLVAYLQTGQVFIDRPDKRKFAAATRRIIQFGTQIDLKRAEETWFQSRVLDRDQYEAILRLLKIFALHLAAVGHELAIQAEHAEAPAITKARAFISVRCGEDIALAEVARAVNMSVFYFCKSFKKATGMTFTTYLARVRVEKVKNLLLNPHKRISEIAFEAGFQSLSQFNRVFRRIAGQSPLVYRAALHTR
jgi:AraC-like DNA-binding protein